MGCNDPGWSGIGGGIVYMKIQKKGWRLLRGWGRKRETD